MKDSWDDYKPQREQFLKILHEEAVAQNIEFLYYYVKNQLEYYSSCFVKDSSIIEINLKIQMTDLGDEIFDCIYSTVARAIYGQERLPKNAEMDFEMKGDNLQMARDGVTSDGMVDMEYERDGEKHTTRGFAHIGSNSNLLQIHWTIDLKKIQ